MRRRVSWSRGSLFDFFCACDGTADINSVATATTSVQARIRLFITSSRGRFNYYSNCCSFVGLNKRPAYVQFQLSQFDLILKSVLYGLVSGRKELKLRCLAFEKSAAPQVVTLVLKPEDFLGGLHGGFVCGDALAKPFEGSGTTA